MKIIKGDLIKLAEQGEFDIIVHGANCFHTMGSGIARQLATKYPQVLEADRNQTEYGDKEKLGTWSASLINDCVVINAYTQYLFGLGKDVFEYDAFEKFLSKLANLLVEKDKNTKFASTDNKGGTMRILPIKKCRIGSPMIGAGLAGGDWSRISKMIEKFSEDVASYADVTVVEYQP